MLFLTFDVFPFRGQNYVEKIENEAKRFKGETGFFNEDAAENPPPTQGKCYIALVA